MPVTERLGNTRLISCHELPNCPVSPRARIRLCVGGTAARATRSGPSFPIKFRDCRLYGKNEGVLPPCPVTNQYRETVAMGKPGSPKQVKCRDQNGKVSLFSDAGSCKSDATCAHIPKLDIDCCYLKRALIAAPRLSLNTKIWKIPASPWLPVCEKSGVALRARLIVRHMVPTGSKVGLSIFLVVPPFWTVTTSIPMVMSFGTHGNERARQNISSTAPRSLLGNRPISCRIG